MRIARALSLLGYASRRLGEELIAAGRVRVNGKVISDPATKVMPGVDVITVLNQVVRTIPTKETYAVYKPVGVVSTVSDPHAERTVVDLVPSNARLYPVGRLDKDSEGLILLTNDGELANLVTHPRYEVDKEYAVLVPRLPNPDGLRALRTGVELDGQMTAPAQVRVDREDHHGTWLSLVLHEGRNREVRRMFEALGLPVNRLIRTRIGPIRLKDLPLGRHRLLDASEVAALRSAATGSATKRTAPRSERTPGRRTGEKPA